MSQSAYQEAATRMIATGAIPFPVSDTLLEILQILMTEEQARFVTLFDQPLNREEIREKSGLDEAALEETLNRLMDNGVIFGLPSKTTGVMVYRLLAPLPGIFESTMMRGESGDRQHQLARLFEQLFAELTDLVQSNYEAVVPALENIPPMTRIVPVEQQIDHDFDTVMPCEDVKKLVDRFDTMAVATCYCRHQKDLLGQPCQTTDQRQNCLFFGKTAEFYLNHRFAEPITPDQAKQILDQAEQDGLVHKAFHEKYDTGRDEFAICNCCPCCCETFQSYYGGRAPAVTYTAYLARLDADTCSGCGDCAAICPMQAIELVDEIAGIEEARCIGCGLCAYHCPTGALTLERTGQRTVFVPPPRLDGVGPPQDTAPK